MYCKRCGKLLPEDANYCLHCGAAQEAGVIGSYEDYRRRQRRQLARVGPAVAGGFFLIMLLVMAYQFHIDLLSDIGWWAAVLASAAMIVVPQIVFPWLWRKEDGDKA